MTTIPGTSGNDRGATGHRQTPAAIAARLAAPQLIAQLFVVGVHGTTASRGTLGSLRRHGWGGVILTPANWAGPRFTKQLTAKRAEPPAPPIGCRRWWG